MERTFLSEARQKFEKWTDSTGINLQSQLAIK